MLVDGGAGKLAGENSVGAGFPKITGDVLAGAQVTYRQAGAKSQVPKLAPVGFFIQMAEYQILQRQDGEGPHLRQQDFDVVSPVQNQVYMRRTKPYQLCGKLSDGQRIAPIDS